MADGKRRDQARELTKVLGLASPPIAITFTYDHPIGVERYDAPMPPPTAGGRTGRVPAGCVFWMHAAQRSFLTVPEDHGNCGVGMLTHGLQDHAAAATREDVKAIIDAGWVTPEAAAATPRVQQQFPFIVYGPLAANPVDPDVVLLRLNARGLMILMDAIPSLRVEGKPQCHVVPIAKELGNVVVSAGCALSRARTGMPASEMTCAIPGRILDAVIDVLKTTAEVDTTVARYAGADNRRFGDTL